MMESVSSFARGRPTVQIAAGLVALVVLIAVVLGSPQGIASAGETQLAGKWGGPIDPDALQILKAMTDYLGGLQQFGMHTENTYEDVLETEQKIQFHFSSDIVIQRPDKLRAEQSDGMTSRLFVYDGQTLVMFDGGHDFYSTMAAPDNIDDFLHFARDALDLVPPVGDLVFSNAFELLTAGMTSGFVVGKAVIGGVRCDHLAFTTPVVDWQVWIADGDTPLPYKYVLTTRDDSAQPQFVTVISKWTTNPKIDSETFDFDPPATATEIDFVRADAGVAVAR